MELRANSELQGGKYRIIKTLGQGGFGITYLAEQTMMGRRVCIKEFFLKEYCNRDDQTSQVSLGTVNNKSLMEKYQEKFIKEARLIARFDHPNVIRIHDVFAENNTAYYVMDFIEGSSLNDIVKMNGPMAESEALRLIKAVGDGLSYVHAQGVNHLDVKPGNIMVRDSDGKPVLIDFGMSKQYDEGGEQTSSTPIGISEGYAPLEQYNIGGVSTFSPQTDIYSLAATLYRLVTGQVPPKASEVMNEGLPEMPETVSQGTRDAIEKAMQFRKKDRPDSVSDFLGMLGMQNQDTDRFSSDDSATMLVMGGGDEGLHSISITSFKSRISALSALSSLGIDEDKAFEMISSLPCTILQSVGLEDAQKACAALSAAGCEVEMKQEAPCNEPLFDVIVTAAQNRIHVLSAFVNVLKMDEDQAFELLSSLPGSATVASSLGKKDACEMQVALESAGCTVEIVECTPVDNTTYSVIITAMKSKLTVLEALAKEGMSEDEAFELISSIPATVGTGLREKDAKEMAERLSQAGCQVECREEDNDIQSEETFDVALTWAKSQIFTINTLVKMGLTEDEAFEKVSSIPCIVFKDLTGSEAVEILADCKREDHDFFLMRHGEVLYQPADPGFEWKPKLRSAISLYKAFTSQKHLAYIEEKAQVGCKAAMRCLLDLYRNGEYVSDLGFIKSMTKHLIIRLRESRGLSEYYRDLLTEVQNRIDKAEHGRRSYDMALVSHGSFDSYWGGTHHVDDFYIGTNLVTLSFWIEIMGRAPKMELENFKNAYYPVSYISWDDANEFITRLNQRYDTHFRLPSSIEWEYAARGGNQHTDEDLDPFFDDPYMPYPVGLGVPNSLGLYDMVGNLQEWCSDKYDDNWSRTVMGGCVPNEEQDDVIPIQESKKGYRRDDNEHFFGIRLAHDAKNYKPIRF